MFWKNKNTIPFLIIAALISACTEERIHTQTSDISRLMSEIDISGFSEADQPRQFSFPQDHGSHNDFKTEWWYVTGNLASDNGRLFGYQVTFFRWAISPKKQKSDSRWASNQYYLAHFAITDIQDNNHYPFERVSRESLGMAGVKNKPFEIWILDWSMKSENDEFLPLNIVAKEKNVSISLQLNSGKPLVLQGDNGLSRKGKNPGDASYYYSFTRLNTQGSITINEQTFQVSGNSWLDREWSTSALDRSQSGWDWFAIQLANHEEVMFYRLRKNNGEYDQTSSGAYINLAGVKQSLNFNDVIINELSHWKSDSGVNYPASWQLRIPHKNLDLTIKPYIPNQEMNLSLRYWEGAVNVTGELAGKPIQGRGYVELSGYE